MKILIIFVEVMGYSIDKIITVYEETQYQMQYVFCNKSISGHKCSSEIIPNSTILNGELFKKVNKMWDILTKGNFNLVVINGYNDLIRGAVIFYCKTHKIPYAIESDTQLNVPKNKIKSLLKKNYLKWIFTGESYGFPGGTRQRKLFEYYGMSNERIFLMPMTVNVTSINLTYSKLPDKDNLKNELHIKEKKIILYVGRIIQVKNIKLLIDAYELLYSTDKDLGLVIVGSGKLETILISYCSRKNYSDHVHFIGYKTMPEIVKYYKISDVFALPSDFEPWGLVINEALACELPVVASDKVGAVDDLIIEGENGCVFSAGSSFSLQKAIEYILYNKDYYKFRFNSKQIISKWDLMEYKKAFEEAVKLICKK